MMKDGESAGKRICPKIKFLIVLVLEIEIVTPCFDLANKSPVEIHTGANCGGGDSDGYELQWGGGRG